VLCDLEGRTYEEAARHMGCPVGTVKSRLARGRGRLRRRLTGRGLAPGVVVLGAAIADPARGASATFTEAAVRIATRHAAPSAGSASATASVLAQQVLRSMFWKSLRAASLKMAIGTAMAMAVLTTGAGSLAQPGPRGVPPTDPAIQDEPKATPRTDGAASYAWRRADQYEPPNFERFFPDDPVGGTELDALWNDEKKDDRPDAEVLRTLRQGLRRTKSDRAKVLEWIGDRFIWFASPQNPDAIEIVYHASDFRGKAADPYGARKGALHDGLAMVQPKPPAVLRTLVDLCMQVDDREDWNRIAWGTRSQRTEVLSYLKPYLAARDEATREKAALLAKVFDSVEVRYSRSGRDLDVPFGSLPVLRDRWVAGCIHPDAARPRLGPLVNAVDDVTEPTHPRYNRPVG
jgi:hypothetical protein